jgi:hypothetical protein
VGIVLIKACPVSRSLMELLTDADSEYLSGTGVFNHIMQCFFYGEENIPAELPLTKRREAMGSTWHSILFCEKGILL